MVEINFGLFQKFYEDGFGSVRSWSAALLSGPTQAQDRSEIKA